MFNASRRHKDHCFSMDQFYKDAAAVRSYKDAAAVQGLASVARNPHDSG